MSNLSRSSQLERLLRLHRLLQNKAGICVDEFAAAMEVSRRTVYRDIDILRDRFGAPIQFVRASRRWRYFREVESLDELIRLRLTLI